MKKVATIICVIIGLVLIWGLQDLPEYGSNTTPANKRGTQQQVFLEKTYDWSHVPNIVTAVLADYRGYDTMFETAVIFVAGLAIIGIVRVGRKKRKKAPDPEEKPDIVIKTTTRILMPIIQLYALYVLTHGHYSPGGGFQAGVIFGAAIILYAISFSLKDAFKRYSQNETIIIANSGVLIYAGTGAVCLIMGGNFLEYSALSGIFSISPIMARYWGMFIVEVGVAFTVTTIMFAIYYTLSSQGKMEQGL